MRLVRAIRRFMVHEEIISSENQLKKDFLEFPPRPLVCQLASDGFLVKTSRGVGEFGMYWMFFVQTFSARDTDYFKNNPDFKDLLVALEKLDKSIPVPGRAASKLLLFLMTFFAAMVFQRAQRKKSVLGVFFPCSPNGGYVGVTNRGRKNRALLDAAISHEHIHLLQFRDSDDRRSSLRFPERVLVDKYVNDKFILYLFDANEVEARLHEIVLSYYRQCGQVPLTSGCFFAMLAGSERLSLHVKLAFMSSGVEIPSSVVDFKERNDSMAEQLEIILCAVKDDRVLYRFITEVLSVMYGRLLSYYGDKAASQNFLLGVQRPNMYDMAY